jgi:Fe2+ or Zn2+ uptake regulation protein
MNDVIATVVRRAILDLLEDIGGEHNHEELQLLLNELGHRLSGGAVTESLGWLAVNGLVFAQTLGRFSVASISPVGRDIANGFATLKGVSPHKTGS